MDKELKVKNKKYKYLLFDLDGTLTLSHIGIYNSLNYALERLGRIPATKDQLKKVIGPPLHQSFRTLFDMTDEGAEEACRIYRERYNTVGLFENKLLPHVEELLQELKTSNYTLCLATAKPKNAANRIAAFFGILQYFDVPGVATEDKSCNKAAVIGEMISRTGGRKEEYLMIGDRADDILGAKTWEIDSAGVRCGYAEEGELEESGATYIFDGLKELKEFLL